MSSTRSCELLKQGCARMAVIQLRVDRQPAELAGTLAVSPRLKALPAPQPRFARLEFCGRFCGAVVREIEQVAAGVAEGLAADPSLVECLKCRSGDFVGVEFCEFPDAVRVSIVATVDESHRG